MAASVVTITLILFMLFFSTAEFASTSVKGNLRAGLPLYVLG